MRPLRGRRVVVTRPEGPAEELCVRLEELGAVALRCPTIRIDPPESFEPLDTALSHVDRYDWLVFTSGSGVRSFLTRAEALGVGTSTFSGPRVAAVGVSTGRLLGLAGVDVAVVPEDGGAESLAAALTPIEGRTVLLPRSHRADRGLVEALLARGARRVEDIVAYRTVPVPPGSEALEELRKGVDAVTFTSPSTVEGFVRIGADWRSLLEGAVVVTLGPVTSEAVREAGLDVGAEAEERSMSGLVEALANGLEA